MKPLENRISQNVPTPVIKQNTSVLCHINCSCCFVPFVERESEAEELTDILCVDSLSRGCGTGTKSLTA